MFNEKPKSNSVKIETLIGEECTITGSISGTGTLKMDGCINGDIKWQDEVIVGVSANCNGNVYCKEASINGKVSGNVSCEGTLTIESCGRIMGDITMKSLVVKEGAEFNGKCTMGQDKELNRPNLLSAGAVEAK